MTGLGFIDPQEHEPAIRAGLEGVLARNDAGWSPDEVFDELNAGRAFCFGTHEGDGLGFVILRTRETYHGRVLFVWIAWSQDGTAMSRHWEEIKSIGRVASCDHIEFWSPRAAFERVSEKLGVDPWMTIYRGAL